MSETPVSRSVIDTLARDKRWLTLTHAPEGLDAAALAEAVRKRGGVTLFVARDEGRASQFDAAVNFFAPGLTTLRLPAWDSLPYDRISPAPGIAAQRCAALAQLYRRRPEDPPLLVIATAAAVAQRVPPRDRLGRATFSARVNGEASMAELEAYLLANGYSRSSVVRAPGEFAV